MPREFKTILCPTDFSDESARALAYALRFAKNSDGTILLAHIIHIPTEHYREPSGQVLGYDQLRTQMQRQLEETRDQQLQGYAKVELLLELGDPFEQLMEIATQRSADLITISTHGRSGITHLIIGSVAEKIIRHAPCPVFVVRRGAAV